VQDQLVGVACVHHCALNSSSFLTTPRALILNPQENPVRQVLDWDRKHTGFVNMQTFKAWKHVHELIEAIAYMPKKGDEELREVAGRGIEYQYLTSEDKCKENYFHGANDQWFAGWKFWDAALGNDMVYHDYWNSNEVNKWLEEARVLVDPSWSNRYSLSGGHYNRVVVDAMIRGAVPVARRLGMGTELFVPGEHYIEIPQSASPQQYADIILEAGNMEEFIARKYRENALSLLPHFNRKNVAERVVRLAMGELDDIKTKTADDFNLKKQSDDIMFNHFGILV
jgi:glycosyltransferase involved in cell wall biosynthesis